MRQTPVAGGLLLGLARLELKAQVERVVNFLAVDYAGLARAGCPYSNQGGFALGRGPNARRPPCFGSSRAGAAHCAHPSVNNVACASLPESRYLCPTGRGGDVGPAD